MAMFDDGIRGPMDQLTAHLDRGWDLITRGDLAGALLSAEKSLELDAESPEAHNLLGYIHAAEGNAEQALDHYQKAIDLDETFVEAMLNAAEVLIHPMGDYDGALRLVEDALDYLDDDDEIADAMLLRVDILLHVGDGEAAEKVVRALPDGPFDSANLEFLIGRAKFEVGDLEGSETHVRRALDKEPDHAEAHYYVGLLLEQKGDVRGSTVSFLQSRELDLRLPPPPWSIPVDQFERKVQASIMRLPEPLRESLEGALVVVGDVPGAEVVADGIDPRLPVLIDALTDDPPRAGRLFIYQRNVERTAHGVLGLDDELSEALERELAAAFAMLAEEHAIEGDHPVQQ